MAARGALPPAPVEVVVLLLLPLPLLVATLEVDEDVAFAPPVPELRAPPVPVEGAGEVEFVAGEVPQARMEYPSVPTRMRARAFMQYGPFGGASDGQPARRLA